MSDPPRGSGALVHEAFFYADTQAYVRGVAAFLHADGYDGPALVAVPTAELQLLRAHLAGQSSNVQFTDMTQLGANPSRIIPAVRAFVGEHVEHAVRFVGEPIWPGRSDAEIAEATRHEALINVAFADTNARILCPYDTTHLGAGVLADAEHTHPHLVGNRARRASARYTDPVAFIDPDRWPLPPRPADAERLDFDDSIQPRQFLQRHIRAAGLDEERSDDLLLAGHEVCANSLRHGPGHGTMHVWSSGTHLVVEVYDTGTISDPLAGRMRPRPGQSGGRGLYLAHQVCDLVEVRSGAGGTTVRLHTAPG